MSHVRPKVFLATYCLSALAGTLVLLSPGLTQMKDPQMAVPFVGIVWFVILILMSAVGMPIGLGLATFLEERGIKSRWTYAAGGLLIGSVPFLAFGWLPVAMAGALTGLLASQSYWQFALND